MQRDCSCSPNSMHDILKRILNARVTEGITAMLLNINRRYKAVTSIRILGLDGPAH